MFFQKKGFQVVLDTDKYGVRHYILGEIHAQKEAKNVSTSEKKGSSNNDK